MKIKILILISTFFLNVNGQTTSTGIKVLGNTGMTLKIDTNTTNVTLTLTGPSNSYLAIGFGGTTMSTVTDMFIWNNTSNRDYVPSGGYSSPIADVDQSWIIISDTVSGSIRTVIATRTLISSDDYTFTNTQSVNIPIIFAKGTSSSLTQHLGNNSSRGALTLSTVLSNNDFQLERSTLIFPNPTNGYLKLTSNQNVDEVALYTTTGKLVKKIRIDSFENELQLNLTNLEKGIYILTISAQDQKIWKKLIIE